MTVRPWLAVALLLAATTTSADEKGSRGVYQTANTRWQATNGAFAGWTLDGVVLAADGSLRLSPDAARGTDPFPAGGYNGKNYYNGGRFIVGEATSPVVEPGFNVQEAIPSWNATTPAGTWLETQVRVRFGRRWSRWYSLGVWTAANGTVERHSVNKQADEDGKVSTDTLVVTSTKESADALQVKLRLFSERDGAAPTVTLAAVAASTKPMVPTALTPGNPAYWSRTLAVPECSQMVYPDGGNVWCSPTSVSMVLAFHNKETGACEPRVRTAVSGVFDWAYKGHGNWAFNAAFAGSVGYVGWVGRFTSLAEAERWVHAGVPLVLSYGWGEGELAGAPIPKSGGHLTVLVGFDADGNPVVNDPAAASDEAVQRTYPRAQLERLWLKHSGGTVYVIHPAGMAVPE